MLAEYYNIVLNLMDSLDQTQKLILLLLAIIICFYILYRFFGALVALAAIFAVILGYAVFNSDLTGKVNDYEKSKNKRLMQIEEEANKTYSDD